MTKQVVCWSHVKLYVAQDVCCQFCWGTSWVSRFVTQHRPSLRLLCCCMHSIGAVATLLLHGIPIHVSGSLLNPTSPTAHTIRPASSIGMHNQLHMQTRHASRLPIAAPRPRPCILVTLATATNQSSTEKLIEGFWEVLLMNHVNVLLSGWSPTRTPDLQARGVFDSSKRRQLVDIALNMGNSSECKHISQHWQWQGFHAQPGQQYHAATLNSGSPQQAAQCVRGSLPYMPPPPHTHHHINCAAPCQPPDTTASCTAITTAAAAGVVLEEGGGLPGIPTTWSMVTASPEVGHPVTLTLNTPQLQPFQYLRRVPSIYIYTHRHPASHSP